jgi:hypothetical protein
MFFYINEKVTTANSSARVQSFNKKTNFIVLVNIERDANSFPKLITEEDFANFDFESYKRGEFANGSIIVGAESGTVATLTNFSISLDYSDSVYGDTSWEDLDNMVFESGDGRCELIGIDEHFTGLPSQDYQSTYLIREK